MTQVCNMDSGDCCGLSQILDPKLFKALCEPMRLGLLVQIAQLPQPSTVSEIASGCPIDLSVVSRHLALLRDCGILRADKRGKEVYYSVRYHELAATLRAMAEAIERCCPKEEATDEQFHHTRSA